MKKKKEEPIKKGKRTSLVKYYNLVKKYGSTNIYEVEQNESIEEGIVKRLLNARDLGVPYAVIFDNVLPLSKIWDKFGDGTWHPKRNYITTEDIADPKNDREKERKNIYDFLRGKKSIKPIDDEII